MPSSIGSAGSSRTSSSIHLDTARPGEQRVNTSPPPYDAGSTVHPATLQANVAPTAQRIQHMMEASASGQGSGEPSNRAPILPPPYENQPFEPDPRLQRRLNRIANPAVKNGAQALLLGKGKQVDSRAAAIRDLKKALGDLPINNDFGPRRQREYALEGIARELGALEGEAELQAMRLLTRYLSPEMISGGFTLPDQVQQHLAQNGSPQQIVSEASRVNILGSLLSENTLSTDALCQTISMAMRNVDDPGKIADIDSRAGVLATALERWLHLRSTDVVDLDTNFNVVAIETVAGHISTCAMGVLHSADTASEGFHSSPELVRLRTLVSRAWPSDAHVHSDGRPPEFDAGINWSSGSNDFPRRGEQSARSSGSWEYRSLNQSLGSPTDRS